MTTTAARRHGSGLCVREPGASTSVDGWQVHHWPADLPDEGLVALRLPLPVIAGTRFIRNGWQSWSAPSVGRLGGCVARHPRAPFVAPRHLLDAPPYDGDESYDVLAADGFVAGFVAGGGVLVARPRSGDLLAVREAGGAHPPVWCREGDADPLVADLLGRCAGRVPARLPLGWSSWTAHGERIDAAVIAAELDVAAELAREQLLDLFAVDDGWQRAVGDWVAGPSFPQGVAGIADDVRAAGLVAGLWLSPFLVAPTSEVATHRPEWLLRDRHGEPVPVISVPHWGGAVWALDVTRPDVLEHLRETAARLVAAGFGYLKLDFLYAAALPGAHAVPSTAEARTRGALAALREGAGDATFLVGCGAPLWPAIGLVDGMRVGPDVTPAWGPPPLERTDRMQEACLSNGWRSARLRAPMNGRLWANDADAVMIRRQPSAWGDEATDAERRAFGRWVAQSGGLLFDSDRLTELTDDDRSEWSDLVLRHRALVEAPEHEPFAPARIPLPRAERGTRPVQLLDGLWLVAGRGVTHPWDANAYLVAGDRPVLVDCGSPAGTPALVRNLERLGVGIGDLHAVVATHCHWDHVGGAAALAGHGVPVLMLPADLTAVRDGDPIRTTARLLYGAEFPAVADAGELADGQVFDVAADVDVRVVATPGHTPGSACFVVHLRAGSVLLAGDTLWGGFSTDIGSDLAVWRRSLERVAAIPVDWLSWGHAPPKLYDDTSRRLREAAHQLGRFFNPWFKPFDTEFHY